MELTLSYSTGGLSFGVIDQWSNDGHDPQNRYFKYDAHGTNHVFEAFVGYDFGVLSATWYTNFAGCDGLNKKGKRAYSSYMELTAPFRLGGVEWLATAGATPYATDYYDATGFAVTELSLRAEKSIRITDSFSLPLFAQLIAAPNTQHAYLVFGFTLRP